MAMHKSFFYFSLTSLFLLLPAIVVAEPIKPYLKLDTFLYSEPVSIEGALTSKQDSYKSGGEHQIGSVWLETGIKKGRWSAATLYREEHRYTFSPDTADLNNSIESTHTVDPNRQYQIDLEVERFRAKGLRIGYLFKKNNQFEFQVGGSYFQTSKLLSGKLVGTAVANSSSDYDYNIDVDYTYDKEVLFGRTNVIAPTGNGFSIDLNGKWNINNRLLLIANIKDIYAKIRWENTPTTVATATSDVKVIGEDGFVVINPSITGAHSTRKTYTQNISPSGRLDLKYKLNKKDDALLLKTRFFSKQVFTAIGGERRLKQGVITGAIWPALGVVEVGYKNKKMGVSLGIDNINVSKANVFWLSLEIN